MGREGLLTCSVQPVTSLFDVNMIEIESSGNLKCIIMLTLIWMVLVVLARIDGACIKSRQSNAFQRI